MNIPTINIDTIPDLDIMATALSSGLETLPTAATSELVIIVAIYFFETSNIASILI